MFRLENDKVILHVQKPIKHLNDYDVIFIIDAIDEMMVNEKDDIYFEGVLQVLF